MSKKSDGIGAVVGNIVSVDKFALQKVTERKSSAKTSPFGKPESQQSLELMTSFQRKKLENRELQQKQKQEKKAKTDKPSSSDDWKRNLYVKGLFTSTRIKELQKYLLEATGAETVACSLIPGEPCYLKITMATIKDASKCLQLLNDNELFGKHVIVERKERVPERNTERSRSNSFSKELRDFSHIVSNSHAKCKRPKSKDRSRSRSRDRVPTSSRSDRNRKMPVSKERKMRSKSRERNRERSRSPVKKGHRKKPSINWDIPPIGYENMTPMQYKEMRAQEPPKQMQGLLFVDSTANANTVEMEETSYTVPESIVHELFIGGLLNHLTREHVEKLLECERRYLEEKIQFEYERAWQRSERESLEREKIEIQRERERFEREQWIEREKIKAEREEIKRRQARSIAKKEQHGICAPKTTTQGTDQPRKQMPPVVDLPSIPVVRSVGLQVQLISSSGPSEDTRFVTFQNRSSGHTRIEERSEAIALNDHREVPSKV